MSDPRRAVPSDEALKAVIARLRTATDRLAILERERAEYALWGNVGPWVIDRMAQLDLLELPQARTAVQIAEHELSREHAMTLQEARDEIVRRDEIIASLREQVAVERARRAEQLSSVADTLERASETVRQMAREQ